MDGASRVTCRRLCCILCGPVVLFLAGCGESTTDRPEDKRLPVVVDVPPLAYLVQQIGGEHVKVDVLVRAGQDPHTFEPDPQQVLALGKAAVFFTIDMPFETILLQKVQEARKRLTVVDTTHGIQKRMVDTPCSDHAGDHAEDHDHGAEAGVPDPHVWLSPPLLKIQAENIAASLSQADPEHRADYQRNLTKLLARLDALHQRIQRMLEPFRGRAFYVFHPGFGYFADAYGLKEEAIERGGREPTPKQLRDLVRSAKADGVTTVFVQPQSPVQGAKVIADAIGGRVVTINGLDEDVVGNLEDIAAKIEAALRGRPNGK